MSTYPVKRVSPVFVFVASLMTLGIYLLFWYERIYREIETLTGETPTGNSVIIDLILAIVTAGIWAIYVDYRISSVLTALEDSGMKPEGFNDSRPVVVILDVAAYFSVAITFILSSAIQQDQLNRIMDRRCFSN